MERTVATIAITVGLAFATAGGMLFADGHGLAAVLCILTTISCGVLAFFQPV